MTLTHKVRFQVLSELLTTLNKVKQMSNFHEFSNPSSQKRFAFGKQKSKGWAAKFGQNRNLFLRENMW